MYKQSKAFKYYLGALVKAQLVTIPLFYVLYIIGVITMYPKKIYFFILGLCINIYFQLQTPNSYRIERIEDEWDYIRITRGKKGYDRYLDEDIVKELKNVK